MVKTDSIARPSMLLRSTVAKMCKAETNVKPKEKASTDSLGLVSLKAIKPFKLSDLHFEEEGYFKGSKYFKAGKNSVRYGTELGDPVPYTLNRDNTLAGVLLACFIIAMLSFSASRSFIVNQLQTFFKESRRKRAIAENEPKGKVMPLLMLQTSLLLSVIFFIAWSRISGDTYEAGTQLIKIGIYFGEFIVYFVLKRLFYSIIDWTFFEREQNHTWAKVWLFLSTIEGVLLFPLVLLLVYFHLSFHIALIYSVIVVFSVKILQLYKSYAIFFSRKSASLQIILYFCTLEIIPLILLWGVLELTGNYLNINI